MKLPIFELTIDDEVAGMYALALVANPATETAWLAFDSDVRKVACSIVNEEERKVLCVICRADFPIYRCDENGEYYVIYHRETIDKMSQKFLNNGFQTSINIEHDENAYIDGVELTQIFIKDTEKGISPVGFEQIEEGSLFGVYKIVNEDVWNAIKKGVFTSVSLEGIFKVKPEEKKSETLRNLKELFDYLKK